MYNASPLSSCNHKWFANFLPDDSRIPPSPAIHRFSDSRLEQLVFLHRSTHDDNPFITPNMPADSMVAWNNEQLEFLGDGVLKALTADLLNDLFPAAGEGELTVSKFYYFLLQMALGIKLRRHRSYSSLRIQGAFYLIKPITYNLTQKRKKARKKERRHGPV